MWHDLLVAIALLLVIEGVLPFANPEWVRRMLISIAELNDHSLRFAGLTCMVIGCLLLYAVK